MKIRLLAGSLLATLAIGCSSGGGESSGINLVTASEFADQINHLDPYSYNSKVIKSPTAIAGHVVFYDGGIGEYVAIDIEDLRNRGYSAYDAAASYIDGYITDTYEIVDYAGGGYYEGWETGLLYEETEADEKDVLFAAKVMEGLKLKNSANLIAEEYGLSEEKGLQISTLSMHWDKLSKTREMTNADLDAFSEDLFGFNVTEINSAMSAYSNGDGSKVSSLIEEAAKSLDTTPENVKNIIADFSK